MSASGTRIQSVARGAQLVKWVAARPEGAMAKEIAFANQLALPTAYHLLNTLVEQGVLAKDDQRRYVLGQAAAELARAYHRAAAPSPSLLDRLRELADETAGTVSLAEWSAAEIRVSAIADPQALTLLADPVCQPMHEGHLRASGKVLLAHASAAQRDAYLQRNRPEAAGGYRSDRFEAELARIRGRGYACDDGAFDRRIACVSAPLRRGGKVGGAVGVSVPVASFGPRRAELAAALIAKASACAAEPGLTASPVPR